MICFMRWDQVVWMREGRQQWKHCIEDLILLEMKVLQSHNLMPLIVVNQIQNINLEESQNRILKLNSYQYGVNKKEMQLFLWLNLLIISKTFPQLLFLITYLKISSLTHLIDLNRKFVHKNIKKENFKKIKFF